MICNADKHEKTTNLKIKLNIRIPYYFIKQKKLLSQMTTNSILLFGILEL